MSTAIDTSTPTALSVPNMRVLTALVPLQKLADAIDCQPDPTLVNTGLQRLISRTVCRLGLCTDAPEQYLGVLGFPTSNFLRSALIGDPLLKDWHRVLGAIRLSSDNEVAGRNALSVDEIDSLCSSLSLLSVSTSRLTAVRDSEAIHFLRSRIAWAIHDCVAAAEKEEQRQTALSLCRQLCLHRELVARSTLLLSPEEAALLSDIAPDAARKSTEVSDSPVEASVCTDIPTLPNTGLVWRWHLTRMKWEPGIAQTRYPHVTLFDQSSLYVEELQKSCKTNRWPHMSATLLRDLQSIKESYERKRLDAEDYLSLQTTRFDRFLDAWETMMLTPPRVLLSPREARQNLPVVRNSRFG